MRIKLISTLALLLIFGISQGQNKYVASGEWFWDTDPGIGNGTAMTATDGNFDQAIESILESSSNIPALGVHTFNVRVQSPNGTWGPVFTTVIDSWESVVAQQDANVTLAEFYWDTDPGAGNGTQMLATDGNFDQAVEAIMASSANIPTTLGPHILHVRAREDEGIWGPTFATVVDVWANVSSTRSSFVKSAEYYFDTDPGPGNGTAILAQDGNFNQTLEAIIGGDIPAPVAQGIHVLYIRPMDEEDEWGPSFGIVVNMDTTLGAPPFNTIMAGPDEICEPDLTEDHVYTATQHVGTSFTWTATGGSIVTGDGTNEVTVNWDGTAPYSIKVVECDVAMECDSIEFNIDVLMPISTNTTATICAGDSIFLEGAWQTKAGQFTDSFTVANGCDSSVVTTLSVTQVVATCQPTNGNCQNGNLGTASVTVSGGSGPYLYLWSNGATTQTITGLPNGTFCVTVTDNDGCTDECCVTIANEPCCNVTDGGEISADQSDCGSFDPAALTSVSDPSGGIGTLEIIWLMGDCSTPSTTWVVIPGATSLSYDPGLLTETTCFMRVSRNAGCTAYVGESNVITITVNPSYQLNTTAQICDGDSIFLEGNWQFLADDYMDVYTTSEGCDSIVNTTVSLLDSYFTQESLTLTIGDSAFLENEWQHTAGLYYDTLEAVNGCDSIIETDFQYSPVGIVEGSVDVKIYPNPVAFGQTIIANFSNTLDKVRLEVIDMSGRSVLVQNHFNTDQIQLKLDLATGIYRINLRSESFGNEVIGRKLVVK